MLRILNLEDNPADADLIKAHLTGAGVECVLTRVETRKDFLDALAGDDFDLIVSDYTLPAFDGLSALELVRRRYPRIPFVFCAGTLGEEAAVEALKQGATDYVVKDRLARLAPAVQRAVLEVRERTENKERLRQLAFYDRLTGLPNRALIEDRLELAVVQARRAKRGLALLFFDLDDFKSINDSLGHPVGDQLLRDVAERLRTCLRQGDTAARWGGDEFIVLLPDVGARRSEVERGAARVAEKIRETLAPPFALEPYQCLTSASIGIALSPWDGENATELIQHADAAMYQAKREGRNNVRFYAARMNVDVCKRLAFENDLRQAIKRAEFTLLYQPQVDTRSGRVTGVEALLRWEHPVRGVLLPDSFIPLAEQTGQIIGIGEWVLAEAMAQLGAWRAGGIHLPRIAVNVSPLQFRQPGFIDRVRSMIAESRVPSLCLEFELTEGILMQDTDTALEVLEALRELGVGLAVDDFGTGYSSLRYLKRLPIDVLKIDRSFVSNITTDRGDAAIAEAILALARALGLRVIAEGVETEAQRIALDRAGCHECQGYYFSPPLSAEALATLLSNSALLMPQGARKGA